jgi:hypothetical protein
MAKWTMEIVEQVHYRIEVEANSVSEAMENALEVDQSEWYEIGNDLEFIGAYPEGDE